MANNSGKKKNNIQATEILVHGKILDRITGIDFFSPNEHF